VSYRVVELGMDFTARQLGRLAGVLDNEEAMGYELVLVFPVTVTSCLFSSRQSYMAVFRRRDRAAQGQPPPAPWAPPPPTF